MKRYYIYDQGIYDNLAAAKIDNAVTDVTVQMNKDRSLTRKMVELMNIRFNTQGWIDSNDEEAE